MVCVSVCRRCRCEEQGNAARGGHASSTPWPPRRSRGPGPRLRRARNVPGHSRWRQLPRDEPRDPADACARSTAVAAAGKILSTTTRARRSGEKPASGQSGRRQSRAKRPVPRRSAHAGQGAGKEKAQRSCFPAGVTSIQASVPLVCALSQRSRKPAKCSPSSSSRPWSG